MQQPPLKKRSAESINWLDSAESPECGSSGSDRDTYPECYGGPAASRSSEIFRLAAFVSSTLRVPVTMPRRVSQHHAFGQELLRAEVSAEFIDIEHRAVPRAKSRQREPAAER